jgi:hypothetical protein
LNPELRPSGGLCGRCHKYRVSEKGSRSQAKAPAPRGNLAR